MRTVWFGEPLGRAGDAVRYWVVRPGAKRSQSLPLRQHLLRLVRLLVFPDFLTEGDDSQLGFVGELLGETGVLSDAVAILLCRSHGGFFKAVISLCQRMSD